MNQYLSLYGSRHEDLHKIIVDLNCAEPDSSSTPGGSVLASQNVQSASSSPLALPGNAVTLPGAEVRGLVVMILHLGVETQLRIKEMPDLGLKVLIGRGQVQIRLKFRYLEPLL